MILAVALVLSGFVAIAASELLARRLAPRYVLGRTLAGARNVSIDEARAMALAGDARYVRVHGRITSDEEFPDEQERPLVYRRKRVELRRPDGSWRIGASETEGVPFGVESRASFVAVDAAAIGAGLVVVPRQADGSAADLPAELATDAEPGTAARLVVEQVSAVEHAYVAGVPRATADGLVTMSASRNRPLILTTLEIDDAMRLLGGGQRPRAFALSGVLIIGAGLILAGIVVAVATLV